MHHATDVIDRERHTLYARLPAHRRLVARALALLREHMDATCFVAFSGGKDSAVVAHLCNIVRPGLPLLMADWGGEWLARDRERWQAFCAAQAWDLRVFSWDKWGAVAGASSTEAHQRAAHGSMFDQLQAHAREHGLDTVLMGLRSRESKGRAMAIARRGQVYDYRPGGPYRRAILPLAHWRDADVWAYMCAHELPVLESYARLGEDARSGYVGRSGTTIGRQQLLHQHFPELMAFARSVLPTDSF